ncbi:MAG TPA: hypothetical protein VFR41_16390, partial [Acidimicrobiia bacterium]|nr:hypothetical protein [Acidimicrobiia bacterium]
MATLAASGRLRRSRADAGPLAHLDLLLLSVPLVLSGLGLLMIYDASRNRLAQQGLSKLYYVERQGIAIVLGLVAMTVIMAIDYRR